MRDKTIARAFKDEMWMDRAAAPVERTVARVLARAPILHDALHGTWLGHPVHAAITDVAIGSWSAGLLLDAMDLAADRRELQPGADAAHALGVAAGLAAAATGLTDWTHARDDAKRAGFLHGVLNVGVLGLFASSLFARRRGERGLGVALAGLGWGLSLFTQWLGGELTYRHGVNVNASEEEREAPRPTAPLPAPEDAIV